MTRTGKNKREAESNSVLEQYLEFEKLNLIFNEERLQN